MGKSSAKPKEYKDSKSLGAIYIRLTQPATVAAVSSQMVKINISSLHGPHNTATVSFLPDTGAELDAITVEMYQRLFKSTRLFPEAKPQTATGSMIHNMGSFNATLDWLADDGKSRPIPTTIHVLCGLQQPVLSESTQKKLGMIPKSYPHVRVNHIDATATHSTGGTMSPSQLDEQVDSTVQSIFPNTLATPLMPPATVAAINPFVSTTTKKLDLQKLKAEFPVIFDGVCRPMVGPPCHFVLKEDATPVSIRGSLPVSIPLKPRLGEELKSLEAQGIIRKTDSPTAWLHPIVIAPRQNRKIRLCVDFRALNKHIIRPRFETETPY